MHRTIRTRCGRTSCKIHSAKAIANCCRRSVVLITGKINIAAGSNIHAGSSVCRKLSAPLSGNTTAGAKCDLHVLITESFRNIFRINQCAGNTANAAGVSTTSRSCSQAGIKTDTCINHIAGIIQIFVFQILVQGFHNLIEQIRSRVIDVNRGNDLRIIKAGPHSGCIITRKAAEPSVLKLRSRTGLTGNFHTAEISFPTGTAFNGIRQTIVHIIYRLCTQNLLCSLCVVNYNVTFAVIDLSKGSLLTANTVAGKSGIGTCHITHSYTPCLRTHSQRRKTFVSVHKACVIHIFVDQSGDSKLILCKIKAIVQTDLIQCMGRNSVDRADHTAKNRAGITIGVIIIIGPQAILIKQREVQNNTGRRNSTLLKTGGVNGNRLNGRTGLQLRIGCAVPLIKTGLFTYTTCHCNNVTGRIINHNNCGLQLLATSCFGNGIQIRIDLINLCLYIYIDGSVNVVATTLNLLHTQFMCCAVPGHTILLSKRLCHVFQNSIGKPAVVILRIINGNRNNRIAFRTIISTVRCLQRADNTLIVTRLVGAVCHAVFKIDTTLEHQFLRNGFLILTISQPTVFIHCPENILFSHLIIIRILVRIVICGRVGNADNTCALRCGQALDFFSVISLRSTSDTAAALAQIDEVQIQFQNFILVIALLNLNCSENLKDFTLNRYIISSLILGQQNILDKLLRDTGTTGRRVTKEHSGTSFNCSYPVNTLMFIEAVIFNRHSCMNHILRNILQVGPGAAGYSINVLIFLDAAIGIHIVQIGVLLQIIVININICHRQNIILQIVTKNTGKDKSTDNTHHQYSTCSTNGNFKCAKGNTPRSIEDLQQKIGSPILAFCLSLFHFLFSLKHRIYLHPAVKTLPWRKFFIQSASKHIIVHRL